MRYTDIITLRSEKFRRLTGVHPTIFYKMVEIMREADRLKKLRGGRKNKLCIEDQVLITLEYLREYRTYFHIGKSYGISESSAYKTVKFVENKLIGHPDFRLPGRKVLLKSDVEYDIVLIDATETPIERPKKSKNSTTLGRKKDIPSKVN